MFRIIIILVLVGLLGRSTAVIYKLNVTEYNKMPALYGLDDYEACMAEPRGTYCLVDVNLYEGNNANLMKMIQEYSNHKMKHFNHTQIHRGICVTKTCKDFVKVPNSNDTQDLSETLEACLNNSIFPQYGLEGKLANIQYCNKAEDTVEIDSGDIIMAVVYLVLIVLNFVGSLYDVVSCRKKEDGTGNPYLLAFSIRRNWARLIAPASNRQEPRLERLKLFHGLRSMTMLCVFFSHTTLIISYSYVDNPIYVETSYEDPLKQILFNGSLVTHTFFVMSSFLLAYNFQLYAEKHKVSWVQLPKGILLRYIRLTPTYALIMFSIMTWMRHAFNGPLWHMVVTSEAVACRQYWWAQLLYINNYVYDDSWCMPQSWYLAADTQLFCMGLLVCVIARKNRTRAILLSVLFVVAIAVVTGHTYFQDLEAVVIQSPELYRNLYATDATFRLLYIRGHTNMSTYIIGLAGGFLAHHLQNGKDLNKHKRRRWAVWAVWATFPLGLGVILSGGAFYGDDRRAPAPLRLLYAALYKPIFQTLVITLILGCVFKLESIYRGIVEWRGFTWMGRVSYSAFLLHTLFQRGLVGSQTQLIHMSDYHIMSVLAATIFLTYLSACALWLCVEAPAAALTRAALTRTRHTGGDGGDGGDGGENTKV